jgi:proline racemase
MVTRVNSTDAHVGGAAVRLLVGGVRTPAGSTMARRREWMMRSADAIRRAVMLPPRGHEDLCGALLTEPVAPGSHAGLLFLDVAGFPRFSGAAVIGAVTIAIETGLIDIPGVEQLSLDTPAGTVHARLRVQVTGDHRRVDSVTLTGLPSFVARPGQAIRLGARELRVDIAFGGLFHAIVDTEAIGIGLSPATLPDLRRLARDICAAANDAGPFVHPTDPLASGIAGVVFTAPPRDPEAHLRNVTISSQGAVDFSASVTGTAAVMAVLDAMGLLDGEVPFVHESLIGTLHRARAAQRTQVGETAAVIPAIEATAWLTGEHVFVIDEDDPLKDGIACGDD